jgi:UDP-N-acetylglucosamine 2-epimerase (non-hydrolysing)
MTEARTPTRVAVIMGTRPEAIKLAPVVRELRASSLFEPIVIVTGQHRQMLDQVLDVFDIAPDVDLDIFRAGQTLTDITTATLTGMESVLAQGVDVVLVQGDTTTAMAGALAAFYAKLPVAHVEAGLRTNDRWTPYPEEINRRVLTQLSTWHLAPTQTARQHLLADGVRPERVVVTGNTVIDALQWAVRQECEYDDPRLAQVETTRLPIVLVTAHRRESWGEPLRRIAKAIDELSSAMEIFFVIPAHPNPGVRDLLTAALGGRSNVLLTEPLSYGAFARLMLQSSILLTDSGGLQEEGPSLGKPVLVMRDVTERPEAILAGTACLVGTEVDSIVESVSRLLTDRPLYDQMARAINPYGDGLAAGRCVDALGYFLGVTSRRPGEFQVQVSATQPLSVLPRPRGSGEPAGEAAG